jgi:hypothetical protein
MPNIERTAAGLQAVIHGCERRTLPKSTIRADDSGQGLLHFYRPPSLQEKLASRADAPLRPSRGQKTLPKCFIQCVGGRGMASAGTPVNVRPARHMAYEDVGQCPCAEAGGAGG